ncbi:MAG TPA: CRISPR-associated endonuclease Cas3'', partial [Smithella sp.]|nr:CRISPR-associated endonuclease Cas3'' [Smithella sp.]
MKYIAHVSQDKRIHFLNDHLNETAKLSMNFAAKFGAAQWGYLAGLWHDLGKYNHEFQSKIMIESGLIKSTIGSASKVNHSTAGALWAIEKLGSAGRIFAYLIAGHHAGLPDWHADETGNAALSIRLKDSMHLDVLPKDKIPHSILNKDLPSERPCKGSDPAIWIRMLFSCLVDADFLDTESFMDKKNSDLRGNYPELALLLERFTQYMEFNYSIKADGRQINRIRADI